MDVFVNILLCGSYIPVDMVKRLPLSSEAGNNLQHNLLCEFNEKHTARTLSYIGYTMSVEQKHMIEKAMDTSGLEYVIGKHGLGRLYSYLLCSLKLWHMAKDADVVLLYNYHYVFSAVLLFAKFRHFKTALMIADSNEISEEKGVMRKCLAWYYKKTRQRFDKLIILSKDLISRLDVKNALLFPGAIRYEDYKEFSLQPLENRKIRVLYAGVFTDVTGVDLLLAAIEKIDLQNVEFIFTGRGDLLPDVEAAAAKDKRVVYKGFLPRKEYYELMNSVDILVNPRNMTMPQNMNNFPSKMLEYLASGKVIVSTRFSGYEGFENYHIKYVQSTVQSLRDGIVSTILGLSDERDECFYGNHYRAKEFSWDKKAEAILQYIK